MTTNRSEFFSEKAGGEVARGEEKWQLVTMAQAFISPSDSRAAVQKSSSYRTTFRQAGTNAWVAVTRTKVPGNVLSTDFDSRLTPFGKLHTA